MSNLSSNLRNEFRGNDVPPEADEHEINIETGGRGGVNSLAAIVLCFVCALMANALATDFTCEIKFVTSTPGGLNPPNLSRTHVLKSMPLGRTKSGENAWAHHTASHRTNEGMESQGREGSEGGKAGDQP